MAPAPMTRQPDYKSQVVIDLTGEDEESTSGSVLPYSNGGLIVPGTLPAPNLTGNSRSYLYNRFAPILPANSPSKEATMPAYNGFTYAPILPGATIANRYPQSRAVTRSSNTSATKRQDRTGNKDVGSHSYKELHSTIENPSKRRRTMRDDSSDQELQSTIGNTPSGQRAMREAQEDGRFAKERSYQNVKPTIQNLPKRRRSTRGMTDQESTQYFNGQAQDNEGFTANQRGSMSAISPPQEATSSFSEELRSDSFAQILNDQVFVHIKAAMARHNRKINIKRLHEIGTSVAGVLVNNPMFENLSRYGGVLSRENEIMISEKARHYVDEFVAQSLALPALERNKKEHEPNSDREKREAIATNYNRGSNVLKEIPVPIHRFRSRASSSSPATPVETDAIDSVSTRNEKRKVKQASSIHPPPRRGRHSRAQYDQAESSVSSTDVHDPPKATDRKRPSSQYVSNGATQVDTNPDLTDMISSHDPTVLGQMIDGQPRPYIDAKSRERIRHGLERASVEVREILFGRVYHVDFCEEELSIVRQVLQSQVRLKGKPTIALLMEKQKLNVPELVSLLMSQSQTSREGTGEGLIHSRGPESLTAFLRDVAAGEVSLNARTLRVGPRQTSRQFSSLLRQREMHGMAPVRSCGGQRSYTQEIGSVLEDSLQRKVEWTDCCGDIWAISWTSSVAFVCGATAHSDSHNMQYNKPGNLVVGSVSKQTLDAIPDHRIVRPIVNASENAENALESMRQTQDPWLYTSISAISCSAKSGLTFTASFDGTVKVWRVSPSDTGSSMDILGTWPHEGKVNFVTTSEHHDLVATASDVYNNAVRVYRLNENNLSESAFDTYNGEKAAEQAQELHRKDLWAYYPATVQWGKAEIVSHLLLVGYSPRSISNEEVDIPEDKRNSGELSLWNALDGSRVPIASARTQNVFEVVWHPTKPAFIAATSPCGVCKGETKTQVRLFAARTDNDDYTAFYPIRVLDCPALDINELTVMPNSYYHCYVTASCTDGNTYVWDTGAIGDDAIHVLPHGESLDNPYHDLPRELADTGVKFAAWGKTSDRFYTGASDGRVKAWDIRRPRGKALVREILAASGGIGAGAFSSDFSKLIIGDATGKVHLLTRSEDDPELENSDFEESDDSLRVQNRKGNHNLPHLRGPRLIKHHPEPAPPEGYIIQDLDKGIEISKHFLRQNYITINPEPAIGAIQGPNYHEFGLYRFDAHIDLDGTKDLLPYYQARQQHYIHKNAATDPLPILPVLRASSDLAAHVRNMSLNFEFSKLEPATQRQLLMDGAQLEADVDFEYEIGPKIDIFKSKRYTKDRSDEEKIPN
ncbi:hypothetical protein DSL72_005699 [Monilinia vaccinii-corymbosi]|uniref:Uncharacterized protein n=1 Tax=Monilinia vaccinii-corymbosi TaxID=61207 RepID=A0A8A3PGH0_9HELO|nr:hypothetical protein DSL72_005699 [Monilinia vaccinii-corymbosi]